MILPTNRLIIWTGIIFIPFSIFVAVVQPSVALIMSIFAALFIIMVIIDAFLSTGRLDGIGIELPEIVRFSKGREGEIPVRILNKGNLLKKIDIAFPLPPELISSSTEKTIELPHDNELSSITWPCRALKRGRAFMTQCYVRVASPLTFWSYRKRMAVQSEIRVYPDLFREKKDITFLFQNRGLGVHSQRLIGKGRDFEQLREYSPGDSYEDIHWKATAKRQYPVTKVFQVERTQEVYIIMDASRMSNRLVNGSKEDKNANSETLTVIEKFITSALIMGLVTERIGDLFGFVAFSNKIERFVRAKRGKGHFNALRDALYTLQPVKASPDFSELITFISLRIRHRALLIFMTSLDDPVLADNFIERISVLSRKHLIIVNNLNAGDVKPVFASPDASTTEDVYRNLGRHMIHQNLKTLEKRLKKRGVGFVLLDNDKMNTQLISQYLNIKQKQQL
ncbi:MAG: DUF58 domain-containing protein [Deltaproteobacteria bacterium]|nr:DUF58 domain-containing protein [Deltaproteobacteria bacterium]